MLRTHTFQTHAFQLMFVSVACAAGLAAQDFPQAPPAAPGNDPGSGMAIADQAGPQGYPGAPGMAPYNDPPPPPNGNYGYGPAPAPVPATLTLPSGAFVTVRVNQWLSSDRNQAGDTFYATLAQPLIEDGVVVARKGSMVAGRVSEAHKSHSDSSSRLGLQLTSLSLVDGQQLAVQSQVVDRTGTTTPAGQQAAAVGTTTAIGAGIGAVAAGGVGAAIGAGAGLAASGIGVMLTRGRPTEIYPESMLTFRLDAPVTVSTAQSSAAFHYATQEDYGMTQTRMAQGPGGRPMAPGGPGYAPGYAPGYGAYPYPAYPYPYYPYYYGPGLGIYIGRGYYGGFRGFRR
jgi:hypothetical protein